MAKKNPFKKVYAGRGNKFTSKQDGFNRRRRYFYCLECDGLQVRVSGEEKPKICPACGFKKFQYLASQIEATRYKILVMLERQGDIKDLRCQVTYDLVVNGELICKYRSDFNYIDMQGEPVVTDVKPKAFRDDIYLIKKKLMKACHGIEILELN